MLMNIFIFLKFLFNSILTLLKGLNIDVWLCDTQIAELVIAIMRITETLGRRKSRNIKEKTNPKNFFLIKRFSEGKKNTSTTFLAPRFPRLHCR